MPSQAQLAVQVSLAIHLQVNQVSKHKVFLRQLKVNLHSHNLLVRFNSLPQQWHNLPYKSKILFSEHQLNKTQLSSQAYLANKLLINLQELAVDFLEVNKHNNRLIHPKREVYLAELSLKVQWVEDFLAASNQLINLRNLNSRHHCSDSRNSSNKILLGRRSLPLVKTLKCKINNKCLKLNKFKAIIN